MNIGEERKAVEMPIPVDPNAIPIDQPIPAAEPAEAPVPEHADAILDDAVVAATQSVARQLGSLSE